MFPPFPEDKAYQICLEMIDELEKGSLSLEQIGKESQERSGQGIMLGAALCRDSNGRLYALKTLSGISKTIQVNQNIIRNIKSKIPYDEEIFVDPIVPAEDINQALSDNDKEIHLLTEKINILKETRLRPDGKYENQTDQEKELVEKRKELCKASLKKVYERYSFHCADGCEEKLLDICQGKLPPTGTGDCCAPKILDYAFKSNFKILSMAEVFYGKNSEKRRMAEKYSPCDERCALILPYMLGLKILYRDDDIIVVNKQSGLLSVPGRGPDKQDCIVNRVKRLFPDCIEQPSVHRLDMETSGLLVLAFTKEAHRELNRQFESREVKKSYIALLSGILPEKFEKHGKMELFFRLDVDNRPHQIWDSEFGKNALTEWYEEGRVFYTSPDGKKEQVSRIKFIPHTGRTHQLRLAAADSHGFGLPIIGDTLYGKCREGERLMLHAEYLSFKHPASGRLMEFYCPPDF
ncbi:MAG: RluA family pseudouridine synthase [Treponema sp.]|nr:RluA family pseudouridine synthase [Treponema sp.]